MAISQLYDYRRFHEPPVYLAVLLAHQPSPDGLACFKAPVSKRYGPTEQDSATRPTARSSNRRPISCALNGCDIAPYADLGAYRA
jgi:hypothetical protein